MINEKKFVSNYNLSETQEKTLLDIRHRIDEIDIQLLKLIEKRTLVIKEACVLKNTFYGKRDCFITSAREADMIKILVSQANTSFPKETLINIWRKIITASVIVEANLELVIYKTKAFYLSYLDALIYFDTAAKTHFLNNEKNILKFLNSQQNSVAVLPIKSSSKKPWWYLLATSFTQLKVFAKLPFYNKPLIKGHLGSVAISLIRPEKSLSDYSCFVVFFNDVSEQETFNKLLKEHFISDYQIMDSSSETSRIVQFFLIKNYYLHLDITNNTCINIGSFAEEFIIS